MVVRLRCLSCRIIIVADRVKVVRVILNSNDDAVTTLWNNQISTTTYDYLSLKSLLANSNISYSEDEEIV
jgi:hypothetical protein